MRLGLFTCGYQRYPLERAFADAKRFGYDYIELWGGYPHAYVEDLKLKGITPVYLITDHIGFYEKYGWEFLCMVQGDDEPDMSRMYIHR